MIVGWGVVRVAFEVTCVQQWWSWDGGVYLGKRKDEGEEAFDQVKKGGDNVVLSKRVSGFISLGVG